MPLDPKEPERPNPLDKVDPGWREKAAACGAHWRKTFQTPNQRTLEARRAYVIACNRGQGGRP